MQVDDHWYFIVPFPAVQVTVTGPEAALYSLGPGVKPGGGM